MNTPPTTPTQPWHVIERSQEDKITSVWSFNTQREAVDAMTELINKQADDNQDARDAILQTQERILGYHLPVAPKCLRWSTFAVAQCTGSGICPACLGVRLLPTQPEGV